MHGTTPSHGDLFINAKTSPEGDYGQRNEVTKSMNLDISVKGDNN
jgi:hypothetical protein